MSRADPPPGGDPATSHGAGGPALAAVRTGSAHAGGPPPLTMVHGFTQSARCWGPLAEDLGRDRAVVAVDLPGHGGSSAVTADLWQAADLVAGAGGPGDYLGYSLGGRVCLHLALAHPSTVRRLVLIGATPGIADAAARAERRRADEALADRIEHEPITAFLDRWLAQPLFRTLGAADADRSERCRNTPAGLAGSLRRTGTGTQDPLWERLPELHMPVLLLAGTLDVRFAATAAAMARAIGPRAQVALVPGAGHACHRERPRHVAALVRSFLR